jgi:hypothetical protein
MAFVLKQSATYVWPVTFRMPTDGGKYEKQSFDAEFKRLPQSRINEVQVEVQARLKAAERGEAFETDISDISIADEVLMGWAGVVDGDGDEVPFSETAKAELLNVPGLAGSIIEAYFESVQGKKAKN